MKDPKIYIVWVWVMTVGSYIVLLIDVLRELFGEPVGIKNWLIICCGCGLWTMLLLKMLKDNKKDSDGEMGNR
jgi:hypothetical protein